MVSPGDCQESWQDLVVQLQALRSAFPQLLTSSRESSQRDSDMSNTRQPGSISGRNHLVPYPSPVICGASPFLLTNPQILWWGLTSMKSSAFCFLFPRGPWPVRGAGGVKGESSREQPGLSSQCPKPFRWVKKRTQGSSGITFPLPFSNFCLPSLLPQLSSKFSITSLLLGLRHLTFTKVEAYIPYRSCGKLWLLFLEKSLQYQGIHRYPEALIN